MTGNANPGSGPALESSAERPKRKRDAAKSRQAILEAAMCEFCAYGFDGARVERIAKRSRANMRMLYHYFGNKDGLYMAVLDEAYGEIRKRERELDLKRRDPVEGMRQLIVFTFDFFAGHPHFVALINNENLLRGRFLAASGRIQAMTVPLIDAIEDLLRRGEEAGRFRGGVDPVQLYVTIVAQSQIHISNRYTLSILFDRDLADDAWLAERRAHVQDVVLGYLMQAPAATA